MEDRRIEVVQMVDAWNNNVEENRKALAARCLHELGIAGDKIPANRLLYVMSYVDRNSRSLFERTCEICHDLRSEGWDVKINMQAETLVYYGRIEVKKEIPQWCVCIEDPEGVLEFQPFYTDFEHGLSKCSSAYKMGLNAVLYVKTVAEGWKSWWTFNH